MRKIFRSLVTVKEAKEIFFKHFNPKPVGIETVNLFECINRVLAESIMCPLDVPPFDRAIMDGYAVVAEDTFGASETRPVRLKVVDRVRAGEIPKKSVERGEAIEVDTGAIIPPNANAVLPIEYTEEENDFVLVYKRVAPGENIQYAGSDISKGEILLRKGYILGSRDIGILAAVGIREVRVFRRPRVAVFSIGDELIPPGESLSAGKIYDVNSYTLYNSIIEYGGEPIYLGIARDDTHEIKEKILEGLNKADIIISSGSSSAGYSDMIYRIINELGDPGVLVHGIKSKPGKPVLIALIGNKPYFGLPGFPTSALNSFRIFVAPVIMMMAGINPDERLRILDAKLARRIRGEKGRRVFKTVSLRKINDEIIAMPLPTISGAITTLANTEGYLEIAENEEFIPLNEIVKVYLFEPEEKPADLILAGPFSIKLDKILDQYAKRKQNKRVKFLKMNTMPAIESLLRGEVDIAGVTMLEGEDQFAKIDEIEILRGFSREIALVIRKDLSERIKGIQDALEKGLRIANREKGCSMRRFFDKYVEKMASKKGIPIEEFVKQIPGYNNIYATYSASVIAVERGYADYCIAPVEIAQNYNINYVIIGKENYNFAVLKENVNKPSIKDFINALKSYIS